MKIIATPTRDQVYAGFAYDLTKLLKYSSEVMCNIAQGTILPNLRTNLAREAIQAGATHILFIDSDMRFPYDTIKILETHNEDIVAANCKMRGKDEWTARKDEKIVGSEGKKGLEEVDTVGFGIMLIKISVFEKILQPWFSTPYDHDIGKHVGEDVYFCTMARGAGFKIKVDHDLSRQVRHAGLVEFGI